MGFLVFLIGAVLGSFYLVLGKRLPKNEDVVKSRSHCDNCGHELSWWELIPVVSYIILGGKCHKCKKRIDPLHFLMEIVTGGLFLLGYLYFGFGYEMFMFMIISSLLVLIYVTDFTYFIILDSPLIGATILSTILFLVYKTPKELLIHFISGVALFLAMLLIKFIGDKLFKRESLGGGDIKFAFVMGYILGFRLGLIALIISTFLALPYCMASLLIKKNNEVPYGPFLVSSLFLIFLFMDKFVMLLELINS